MKAEMQSTPMLSEFEFDEIVAALERFVYGALVYMFHDPTDPKQQEQAEQADKASGDFTAYPHPSELVLRHGRTGSRDLDVALRNVADMADEVEQVIWQDEGRDTDRGDMAPEIDVRDELLRRFGVAHRQLLPMYERIQQERDRG